MTDFRMDPEMILGYATTVDESANKLSPEATGQLVEGSLTNASFGTLAQDLQVAQAYERAKTALRRHLEAGAEALRSASFSLRQVTAQHAGNEDDARTQISKINKL